MHRLSTVLIAVLVATQTAAFSQTRTAKISAGQVSFYDVPLACPAARGLGYGSAAKPVLQALEKKSSIQEAWLDHPGTTLAIVWRKNAAADLRPAEIQSVADDRGISLHQLAVRAEMTHSRASLLETAGIAAPRLTASAKRRQV